MKRQQFVCERCYAEAGTDHTARLAAVKHSRKNQYVVHVAIWSKDSGELRHRIPVRDLCQPHADEFASQVKTGNLPASVQERLL